MPKFSVNQLEAGLQAWIRESEDNAMTFVKKLVTDIFKEAVLRTPVDTGLLRGSWNIGVDEEGQRLARSAGEGKFRASDSNLSLSRVRGLKAGAVVVISNPVEYAEYVEEGTPRMPPRKMLRSAVDDTVASLLGGV